jgi:hypothetical protein
VNNNNNIGAHANHNTVTLGVSPNMAGVTYAFTPAKPATTMALSGSNNRSVSVDDLIDFMEEMKARLLILQPAIESHEHFPALKAAYENYLMVERLCSADNQTSR